jgi:hypothetical protein
LPVNRHDSRAGSSPTGEPLRAEQFGRVRRNAPGGQHHETRNRRGPHRLIELGHLDEQIRQAGPLFRLEHVMHTRPPHVGVDQQDALARLGDADREIGRDERLAFGRLRAGDDERLPALIGRREQHVHPDHAKRFREVRRHTFVDERILLALARHERQQAHERQAELVGDLIRHLDAVVDRLEEERQADGAGRRGEQGGEDAEPFLRAHRLRRDFGNVHEADVVGLQLAGRPISRARCCSVSNT